MIQPPRRSGLAHNPFPPLLFLPRQEEETFLIVEVLFFPIEKLWKQDYCPGDESIKHPKTGHTL